MKRDAPGNHHELKKGAEDCVRMKSDGTMNDALCELTWAGPKKQNIKNRLKSVMIKNKKAAAARRISNNYILHHKLQL